MTIISKLNELIEKYENKEAFICLKTNKKISFFELDEKSEKICNYLIREGFKKGDKIVLFIPIKIEFYIMLIAFFKLGIQAVFIDPYANISHINKCCKLVSSNGIIGDKKIIFVGNLLKEIRKIPKKIDYKKIFTEIDNENFEETKLKLKQKNRKEIDEDTPALISFTSGSTGFPKVIMRTHKFLLGQHKVLEKNLKFNENTKVYSSFPIFLLSHIASGNTTIIPNINFRKPSKSKPEKIIQQIKEKNVENFIVPPSILENVVKYCKKNKIIINEVQKIYTGGAPVFPYLMQEIMKIFINSKLRILYGASEVEPISILKYEEMTNVEIEKMKNGEGLLVGKKVNEIDLKIEKLNYSLEEKYSKGEILVKGENVLKGYLDDSTKNEWHKTGDMGFLNEENKLILLGRVKAKIKIKNEIYYPFSIETSFSFCKNVKRTALFSKDEKLYLFIEKNENFNGNILEDEEVLKLQKKFNIYKIFKKKIPIDKRHNSKVDYKKLNKIIENKWRKNEKF